MMSVLIAFIDGAWRGEKLLNLKQIADGALAICDEKLVKLHYFTCYICSTD